MAVAVATKREYYFDIIEDKSKTESVYPLKRESDVKGEFVSPCHMFVDQATNTGYVIVDDYRRLVKAVFYGKVDDQDVQDYKYGLKGELETDINKYDVETVWHEESYDKANHHTTEVLSYIKHMIKDMAYEMDRDVRVYGVAHTRWKKLLALPATFKKAVDDKKQVRKFVQDLYPLIDVEQDIMDALGMAVGILWKDTTKKKYFHAKINKKLPVNVKILVIKDGESVEDRIRKISKKFNDKVDELGLTEIEYNMEHDEIMNCRYLLSFRKTVCWAEIPFHRNLGMIYLHYKIIPKELGEGDRVIVVGMRKKG